MFPRTPGRMRTGSLSGIWGRGDSVFRVPLSQSLPTSVPSFIVSRYLRFSPSQFLRTAVLFFGGDDAGYAPVAASPRPTRAISLGPSQFPHFAPIPFSQQNKAIR